MTPELCPVWCAPTRDSFSTTVTSAPGRSASSWRATASPTMPAPTTTYLTPDPRFDSLAGARSWFEPDDLDPVGVAAGEVLGGLDVGQCVRIAERGRVDARTGLRAVRVVGVGDEVAGAWVLHVQPDPDRAPLDHPVQVAQGAGPAGRRQEHVPGLAVLVVALHRGGEQGGVEVRVRRAGEHHADGAVRVGVGAGERDRHLTAPRRSAFQPGGVAHAVAAE